MGWHGIKDIPNQPLMVELYCGNLSRKFIFEPHRDARWGIGYFDGKDFRWLDTGHRCFENLLDLDHDDSWPTHWRALGPAPDGVR